jgi:Toastrack DUF4097
MAHHHTPGGLRLKLRIAAGRCEIETADTDETVVEAEPLNGSAASRAAVDELVERLRERPDGGHDLLVEVPRRRRLVPGFGEAQVLLRVRAPHGTGIDVSTAAADIAAGGRLGSVAVRTAAGGVTVESAEGPVDVKTASGDVEVGRLLGAGGVHTMSGDVVVAEAGASLTVNTMSGDVRIRRAAAGAIQLHSLSGDLEAAIAPGATMFIDATSTSGDVRSELPVTASAPAGPADVELRATSLSGDITVVRAPEAETVASAG